MRYQTFRSFVTLFCMNFNAFLMVCAYRANASPGTYDRHVVIVDNACILTFDGDGQSLMFHYVCRKGETHT
jgi:hypothetical protein